MAEAVPSESAPPAAAAFVATCSTALIPAAETGGGSATTTSSSTPTALTAAMLQSDEDYSVLSAFLHSQGLSRHRELLLEHEVTFETMLIFEEVDFKDLGIAKGPRIKMLRTCQAWHREQLDAISSRGQGQQQ
jgi:hypothetical protein